MKASELVKHAQKAREKSYAPYSNYKVGAALVTKSGKLYTAGNIENASFSSTLCAERVAFAKAISEGEREFAALAVVGGRDGESEQYTTPCGSCRQVLREFCTDDFRVFSAKPNGDYFVLTLRDLLPYSFGPENII